MDVLEIPPTGIRVHVESIKALHHSTGVIGVIFVREEGIERDVPFILPPQLIHWLLTTLAFEKSNHLSLFPADVEFGMRANGSYYAEIL